MQIKVIKNTSTGLFSKLLGKDRVESIAITGEGFSVVMAKSSPVPISFSELHAIKTRHYFDKMTPYRHLTFVTKDNREYKVEVSPYSGEMEDILKHFARYQLGDALPESIENINILLQGNGIYDISLAEGQLITSKNELITKYPWKDLEYYRIDKIGGVINLKFANKGSFIVLSGENVTNLWLLIQILEKFGKKQGFL